MVDHEKHLHGKLGEWSATAICGNAILSNVLYVSSIGIFFAGIYAPLVFIFVALVLYLYKSIYTEVVEALPVNGGIYNCLLNGTSKTVAAVGGVTTFLCYIATAVISAVTAVAYAHTLLSINILPAALGILSFFAVLVILGLRDASKVALCIFIFHIAALGLFVGLGLVFFLKGNGYFLQNITHTTLLIPKEGGLLFAFYLAFSASLLGVSGFESSANYVEEQAPGVFRKTLKNMIIGVAVFNPLVALVVLNSMNPQAIASSQYFLLSNAAYVIGGTFFQYIIVADAFLVLAGAVLTSYVGVSGLLFRMASDGCLPSILIEKSPRGSYPLIVLLFFILCGSILLITQGNLMTLAGVYTISFLGVMSLFAFGNLLLKETRKELRRTYHASIFIVILAFLFTMVGVFGNVAIDGKNLRYFAWYFVPIFVIVFCLIYQDHILNFLLKLFKNIPVVKNYLLNHFEEVTDRRFVAFIHNTEKIFRILNYVSRNETARNITFVHCKCDDHKDTYAGKREIEEIVNHLKLAGAFSTLNIDVISLHIPFGPEAIKEISKKLRIKTNRILIGSIHNSHPYDYASLGGVRVIF